MHRLALATLAALAPLAAAHAAGDPEAGAAAALRWCTGCHLIRPIDGGPVLQGPPTFQAMARERTPEALAAFLARPHAPMPPIELSRRDIDDLVAYIGTQR